MIRSIFFLSFHFASFIVSDSELLFFQSLATAKHEAEKQIGKPVWLCSKSPIGQRWGSFLGATDYSPCFCWEWNETLFGVSSTLNFNCFAEFSSVLLFFFWSRWYISIWYWLRRVIHSLLLPLSLQMVLSHKCTCFYTGGKLSQPRTEEPFLVKVSDC